MPEIIGANKLEFRPLSGSGLLKRVHTHAQVLLFQYANKYANGIRSHLAENDIVIERKSDLCVWQFYNFHFV